MVVAHSEGVALGIAAPLAGGPVERRAASARWENIDPRQWNDWKWQARNAVTDAEEISRRLALTPVERAEVESLLGRFRMSITPYFLSLIDRNDTGCPIRRQCVPGAREHEIHPGCCADPLEEEKHSPVKGVVHKYPDRALLIYTNKCAMYCRHCTRRRFVGEDDFDLGAGSLERALAYIERTPAIRDVLITGGDPLLAGDDFVERVVARLRRIGHVEIIRIGTRTPVVLPMRITDDLVRMLRKYHPIWVNTQFNHPAEITAESVEACRRIVDAGIPLGNQTVLLAGVNDSAETLRTLFTRLVQARVRPYYLYQCDAVQGIGHFRTRIDRGIAIMKELRGSISGFALPTFVIDSPSGKIPVLPQYLQQVAEGRIVLRDFHDNEILMPDGMERSEWP